MEKQVQKSYTYRIRNKKQRYSISMKNRMTYQQEEER